MPVRGGGGGGRLPARRYGEFGSPERRATDTLLVANVLLFGVQMLSGQLLTAWGIKVRAGGRAWPPLRIGAGTQQRGPALRSINTAPAPLSACSTTR